MHSKLAARLVTLSLIGLALAGCVAVKLSGLTGDYRDTLDRKTGGSGTDAEIASEFVRIADESLQWGEKASKRPTKVAFYRLAAVAGWQAGEPGREPYGAAQIRGEQECESSWDREFKPPRDCAILILVPALVANDGFTPRIRSLKDSRNDGRLPQSKADELSELVAQYPLNTWDFVRNRRDRVEGLRGVEPFTIEWMNDLERVFYCNFASLTGLVGDLERDDATLREQAQSTSAAMFDTLEDAGRTPSCATGSEISPLPPTGDAE